MRACTGLRVVIVALIALAAVLVMPLSAAAADYADVPTWYWAWNYVQGVSDAGVSSGYDDGYWRPSWVVSRDQMAVFIARAMCGGDEYVPTGPATASFGDVPNTGYGVDETDPYWAYDYIEYAVANGITSGYDDELYHPDWDVTRGQMAAFIARAMCGGEESVPDPSGDPLFPDVTDTENSWCYKHVEYIAGEEVTLGYPDGNYYPDIACARDQMAAYLCRAFDLATPTAPAVNITDYYPLEEGDTWVTKDQSAYVTTRTVTGTRELHGRTCTVILDAANSAGDYWISGV
ncbi:MAG: S-layer homology domain-containing protein, partial [Armatimonadetes bacterium]|nr:S-layer homology domain-containing protein [Armatimonadota bacterium]